MKECLRDFHAWRSSFETAFRSAPDFMSASKAHGCDGGGGVEGEADTGGGDGQVGGRTHKGLTWVDKGGGTDRHVASGTVKHGRRKTSGQTRDHVVASASFCAASMS